MQSHLARHQPVTPADDDDLARMRAAAWHRQAVLVVREDDDRLDDTDRLMVQALGRKLYGDRTEEKRNGR